LCVVRTDRPETDTTVSVSKGQVLPGSLKTSHALKGRGTLPASRVRAGAQRFGQREMGDSLGKTGCL